MYGRSTTAWTQSISPPVNLARLMAYSAARNEKSEPSNGTIILFGNSSELRVIVVSECVETTGGDDELILLPPFFDGFTSLSSNFITHFLSIPNLNIEHGLQCTAHLTLKSTRYDRLVIRGMGLGMKAIVIYHTRFGNTERIAKSLEIGLKETADIQDVVCTNVRDAVTDIDSLKEYDIICVGAPTEGFSAPKPIKQFLTKLKGFNLAGKYGFAFDTRVDSCLSGSAARFIEKELKSQGLQIVSPLESAIVFALKEMGTITDARLKEGEDKRFEQIGLHVGTASVQRSSKLSARE